MAITSWTERAPAVVREHGPWITLFPLNRAAACFGLGKVRGALEVP
jgi:hypothetical protein